MERSLIKIMAGIDAAAAKTARLLSSVEYLKGTASGTDRLDFISTKSTDTFISVRSKMVHLEKALTTIKVTAQKENITGETIRLLEGHFSFLTLKTNLDPETGQPVTLNLGVIFNN